MNLCFDYVIIDCVYIITTFFMMRKCGKIDNKLSVDLKKR